jgi:GNAT superfamily N-acetyltransferase
MRIELEHPVKRTGRVMQVEGMFDVPEAKAQGYEFEVPKGVQQLAAGGESAEKDWNVGLIVGPSGAGKSSVARRLWPDNYFAGIDDIEWDREASILDAFPKGMSTKDITGSLTSVGLGSPPSWLRPFHTLSTGEAFRATVARALSESDFVVMDEFTSTVDRQVAEVSSHAVQKSVRRQGKKLIAVTCHFDLIDWLQPDWVYRPDTVDFEWRRLQRHPELELQITTLPREAWPPFSRYHYLSPLLHVAAHCYGAFLGDECVAFNAHIPFPHPSRKNIRMGHRLVVLPDYQGLGIGGRFDDWLGEHLADKGYRYHKTISHPALIAYFSRSPRWESLGKNAPSKGGAKRLKKSSASTRKLATRGFRYRPLPRTSNRTRATALTSP